MQSWPMAPGPSDPFVGRSAECRLLDGVVAAAADGGFACKLLGAPGIGRSALLDRVALASPHLVRRVRGCEAESAVPFATAMDRAGSA